MDIPGPLALMLQTRGLDLLRKAGEYSADTGGTPWHFAVELPVLIEAGLTTIDLRWLIAKGFVEHAHETTRLDQRVRRFRLLKAPLFPPRTCFVLTDAGLDALNRITAALREEAHGGSGVDSASPPIRKNGRTHNGQHPQQRGGLNGEPQPSKTGPSWNADTHELRMGDRLVREFHRPAPLQETILAAFEEDGWAEWIDDPLPMNHGVDAKRRLHCTVHDLNAGQRPRLIRFFVNGGGQRIYWRSARDRHAVAKRSARDHE